MLKLAVINFSMNQEFQDQERKRNIRIRSMVDYSRGAVFTLFGLFFMFFDKLNIEGFEYLPWYRYLGVLFIAYGLWRFYRGYKKNYYR